MIYRIDLEDYNQRQIEKVQKEHREQVEGVYELYDALYISGYCESYSRSRIHYVAYTLAARNIDFKYEEIN